MRFLKPILSLLVLSPVLCFADVVYTLTGQFDTTAPTTTLTAPNTWFVLSLDVSVPAAPYNWDANQSDIGATATYTVGANNVSVFFPELVLWSAGGLSGIVYDNSGDALRLNYAGPVLFSGPTSGPDLITPVSYPADPGSWEYYNAAGAIAGGGSIVNGYVNPDPVPEPASGLFALVVVAAIGFGAHRRKRSAA